MGGHSARARQGRKLTEAIDQIPPALLNAGRGTSGSPTPHAARLRCPANQINRIPLLSSSPFRYPLCPFTRLTMAAAMRRERQPNDKRTAFGA